MCLGNNINENLLSEIEKDPSKNLIEVIDNELVIFNSQCNYLEPDETHILNGQNSSLNVLHANVRGISGKLNEFKNLLHTLKRKKYKY